MKVLRLLRHDAKNWWYHSDLRKFGNVEKASKLERQSIRNKVKDIRELQDYLANIHVRTNTLEFNNAPSGTMSIGGCHPGFFAAFIYCYANRIK